MKISKTLETKIESGLMIPGCEVYVDLSNGYEICVRNDMSLYFVPSSNVEVYKNGRYSCSNYFGRKPLKGHLYAISYYLLSLGLITKSELESREEQYIKYNKKELFLSKLEFRFRKWFTLILGLLIAIALMYILIYLSVN